MVISGSDVDAAHDVAIGELVIGGVGRGVTVSVRVIVTATRRQVMIGAKRAVQHEGKRRHDRKSGRETPSEQMNETNHRAPDLRCISKFLIADFLPVQSGGATARSNCAYLVAFGKIPDSEGPERPFVRQSKRYRFGD
jgi:hypothetical protein